mmetsp:Transcript_8994/g.19418  ORF Transcript_8994/g.19418 Transcript_8994/m.19418 type:complete len:107 (-) Transcript_8994:110-430(-)
MPSLAMLYSHVQKTIEKHESLFEKSVVDVKVTDQLECHRLDHHKNPNECPFFFLNDVNRLLISALDLVDSSRILLWETLTAVLLISGGGTRYSFFSTGDSSSESSL